MSTRAHPSVFTIPAGLAFSRVLAEGVVARAGRGPLALADVTIFVPTRRAVRTLRDDFALTLDGASLGPKILALGDLGDDEITFDPYTDDLELPPAIAPLKRRLVLAKLVAEWHARRGETQSFAQSLSHAGELGRFLDEVMEQQADLGGLETLAPELLAEHWQDVTKFLRIVAETWPEILAASGYMEPAKRRDALIRRQAERYTDNPPSNWVIAAGSTGSIPATRDLLKAIALLPKGAVVLPALDDELDDESWDALNEGHPQYGLRELLSHIGIPREEVEPWRGSDRGHGDARGRFLSAALRPPPTTDIWRTLIENEKAEFAEALDGIALIETANPHEEALAIAIALREALETPNRTAALVTPDRGLARRVASELSRWNIAIDDSAGTPLGRTPPGAFLSLLARAAADGFPPVALLALLKHPLASGGIDRAKFRRHVRALEISALRGLRPEPVFEGIKSALIRAKASEELRKWFAGLAEILAAFHGALLSENISLRELATAHAACAEWLASTNEKSGPEILWRGDPGEAAANLIAELAVHGEDSFLSRGDQYADVFRDLAEARVVRPRFGRHPRLAILGALEARLQSFDLVILGGLNEGAWPAESTTDPWLSRPMRQALGLDAPERRIGLAAHDFATLAASPNVLLTRSLKAGGTPTTPSRWLLRVRQLAKGLGIEKALDARAGLVEWTRELDKSKREPRVPRPEPRPPVSARPRRLSVTQVETWLRDPYAVYARHILRLKPLDPIDSEPGPRERGIAIHNALERFLIEFPEALPPDAFARLLQFGQEAFAEAGANAAARALWWPRFERAANWFIQNEAERRRDTARAVTEIKGEIELPGPSGPFTLIGRADRIEFFTDGTAAILDYKTGRTPTNKQVETLLSPQLPLEGAMLMHGGFAGERAKSLRAFVHIRLTGSEPPGQEIPYTKDATEKAEEAYSRLAQRIARYDDPDQPYCSREQMEYLRDEGDYDHLARVREWFVLGEGGE